ncbi:uncharacterized protein YALI1_F12570g [Yarrowia lipolytica]|uniref:Uncharacterized protein n=1 Tax=Yarrowia lipolytica TaxID=4952 RepID=A0A1D8NML7_YARLL|nr:hypothetical protein YALI1_F12570g [Yarrowia lipolytica]
MLTQLCSVHVRSCQDLLHTVSVSYQHYQYRTNNHPQTIPNHNAVFHSDHQHSLSPLLQSHHRLYSLMLALQRGATPV